MSAAPPMKYARLTLLEAWFSLRGLRVWASAMMIAAACLIALPFTASTAAAETRTLKLYNTHTHERVSITFKKNGRYVSEGLRELNRFLRDWRRNEVTKMDPALFDLIWEVYRDAGGSEPIHVVSGYRSPATNNMLRGRSRGVAKKSQHMRGKAMDFFIPGVNLAKLRATGLRKEIGGVGFYPTSRSPFVHMDTGSVRHWPRMTRTQLARVFPRGDTIHIPTDGKKMPRYAEALARHKPGSKSSTRTMVASAAPSASARSSGDLERGGAARRAGLSGNQGPGLIARLFGGDEDEGDQSAPTPPAPIRSRIAAAPEAAPVPAPAPADAPPGVKVAEVEAPATAEPDPVVIAQVLPRLKPAGFAAVVAAARAGSVAPGTLEAQAQRLASGLPPVDAPATAAERPLVVASVAPIAKPAELRQGPVPQQAARSAVPRPAPADAASAIAAVTGGTAPQRKPQTDLGGATLAFAPSSSMASASALPSAPVGVPQRRETRGKADAASLAGRLPDPIIRDPLARFASLPDRSLPDLISGTVNTRTLTFAQLRHPNQRRLELLLAPGGRVYANRFSAAHSSGSPRSDRFEGPAVVMLPVVSFQ